MAADPGLVEDLRHRPVLVVITGAGATYDSLASRPASRTPGDPDRPPLTQQLFADKNLSEFLGPYRAARSLIAALTVDPTGSDFESLLNHEFVESEGNPKLLSRFVALRLYLRDLLSSYSERWSALVGGATNYAWLVGEVEHWRWRNRGYVAWVTFNYDPLLEDALEAHYQYDFGLGGQADPGLGTYINHPDWCLAHLHGSTRWTRLTSIPRGDLGQQNVADAVVAQWDPSKDLPTASTIYQRAIGLSPRVDSRNAVLLGREHALVGVPAITTPLASKSSYESPPSHVEHLRTVLTQSDYVLALGWRAQEPHFTKLMVETLGNTPDMATVSQSKDSANRVAAGLKQMLGVGAPSLVRIIGSDADGFSGLRSLAGGRFREQIAGLVDESAIRRGALWLAERGVH